MKRIYFLTILFLFAGNLFAQFSGGAGTSGNPYQVANLTDLDNVRNYTSSYFIQTQDIDASSTSSWNSGAGFSPIESFTGNYNGNGHTISALFISRPADYYKGLFGGTNRASISNLGLTNVSIASGYGVGALVGRAVWTTISNCYSTGSVSGDASVGGLVGWLLDDSGNKSVMTNCHSTATITATNTGAYTAGYSIGGLVGEAGTTIIDQCYSTGNVTVSASYNGCYVGGFVGSGSAAQTTRCFSSGNVNASASSFVGGFAGRTGGWPVSNCYCSGSVNGNSNVGGFVGYNSYQVNNSYSVGGVTGSSNVGGFVGFNDYQINGCYWDIETSGQSSSSAGTGENDAAMKTQSTFSGWDFSATWFVAMTHNYGYPSLTGVTPESDAYARGSAATNIQPTSATLSGLVYPKNVSTTVQFLYGTTPGVYTMTVTASPSTVDGLTIISVSADISSLSEATTYYYCVSCSSASPANSFTSSEMSFTTPLSNGGNSLSFDGTDDYVSLPAELWDNNFSFRTAITVEYWFKGSHLSSPYRVQSGDYFVPGWLNTGNGNIYHIISTDGGTNGALIGSSSSINDNTWHHIAMTWQSGGSFISYVDGVQVAQRSAQNVTLPSLYATNYFGAVDGSGEFLGGTLDEVRLWNIVRTPQEIRQNMHRTLEGRESGLVAYWRFNESNGITTASDQTGHGYNGTLTNFAFDATHGQVVSTVPTGFGVSTDVTGFTTGTANMGTVLLTTTNDFDNPIELACTRLSSSPNVVPSTSGTNLVDRYWIITPYGTPGTFSANVTLAVPSSFTRNGSAPGNIYILYHRNGNSEGGWTEAVSGAASVAATTLTFEGITSFSQFMIGASDAGLPVELSNFTVAASGNTTRLNWKTATEVNNYGFEVERRVVSGQLSVNSDRWVKVGYVAGSGTSNSEKSYSFTDTKLNAGKYAYRLKQIDNDGSFGYSQCVEAVVSYVPTDFALSQNYPNPFNPSTTINYQLPAAGHVTLRVYDMLGRETATLVNEVKEAGEYAITFSAGGGSAFGGNASQCTSGIYFYTLRTGNFNETKKMLLLK